MFGGFESDASDGAISVAEGEYGVGERSVFISSRCKVVDGRIERIRQRR